MSSKITAGEAAKAVVRRNTEEVQGGGNYALFDQLFADSFLDHTPQPNCTPDKAGALGLYKTLRAAFPDFHADIHWQRVDGGRRDDLQDLPRDASGRSVRHRAHGSQDPFRNRRCDARARRKDHGTLGCRESLLPAAAARCLAAGGAGVGAQGVFGAEAPEILEQET